MDNKQQPAVPAALAPSIEAACLSDGHTDAEFKAAPNHTHTLVRTGPDRLEYRCADCGQNGSHLTFLFDGAVWYGEDGDEYAA